MGTPSVVVHFMGEKTMSKASATKNAAIEAHAGPALICLSNIF
jgi:hypothetical protein